mmetsp:Transcript_7347/g.18416  ORF Transcript_7347/g.18416 Transcript_7347/m.18416 type:complete len:519 (-) Transcript_7347:68-1624(-)
MAAPCHKVSERCSRRWVILGLALELGSLRLLPLSAAYPMNASCLVFLYFWKESKRSGGAFGGGSLFHVLGALSAWALPFLDPAGGVVPTTLQAGPLMATVLAPEICMYVVALLLAGIVIHTTSGFFGDSALVSCTPPGLNFGVSALLLKALAHILASAALAPHRFELWAAIASLAVLIFGVRSAATAPLRRAMEVHDNLSVLASYGAVSSGAAMLTGSYVYGELEGWKFERQALFAAVAVSHCWGLRALGLRSGGSDARGAPKKDRETPRADDEKSGESRSPGQPKEARRAESSMRGSSVQMVELPSSATGSLAGRSIGAGGGNGKAAGGGPASSSGASAGTREQPSGPLLTFNEPRTVDEDAQIEDKLIARALAPQRLAPVVSGLPVLDDGLDGFADDVTSGNPFDGAFDDMGATPQFDADFEEIIRRFDEDDRQQTLEESGPGVRPIVDLSPDTAFGGGGELSSNKPVQGAPLPPAVLQFDAQTLLDDDGGQDDEDELLRSIEDIPSLDPHLDPNI